MCSVKARPWGLCAASCDLLEQNCLVPDEGCYVAVGQPQCADVAADAGLYEPCRFANACSPGLTCVPSAQIDACLSTQCCTEYCTVGVTECPDGLQCLSAGIVGQPAVGVCVN